MSNDNPYSEAPFKTLKCRPQFPLKAFADLLQARRWVTAWAHWYNDEHRHSAIGVVTPAQRHRQVDEKMLQASLMPFTSTLITLKPKGPKPLKSGLS